MAHYNKIFRQEVLFALYSTSPYSRTYSFSCVVYLKKILYKLLLFYLQVNNCMLSAIITDLVCSATLQPRTCMYCSYKCNCTMYISCDSACQCLCR